MYKMHLGFLFMFLQHHCRVCRASHKHKGNSRERLTAWKDSDDIVAEG